MNPYHDWLGIKTENPNPWELLGLEEDYHDAEIVKAAAMRQVDVLRKFRLTDHCSLAEQIISEVVLARNILLSPSAMNLYLDHEINLLWKNIQVDESEKMIKASEDPLLAILKVAPEDMPMQLTGALSTKTNPRTTSPLPKQTHTTSWSLPDKPRFSLKPFLTTIFKVSASLCSAGALIWAGIWIYGQIKAEPTKLSDDSPLGVTKKTSPTPWQGIDPGLLNSATDPAEPPVSFTTRPRKIVSPDGRLIFNLIVSNVPVTLEVFENYLAGQRLVLAQLNSPEELMSIFENELKSDDSFWMSGPKADEAASFVIGPLIGMRYNYIELTTNWVDGTPSQLPQTIFAEPVSPVTEWTNSIRDRVVFGGIGGRAASLVRVPKNELILSAIVQRDVDTTPSTLPKKDVDMRDSDTVTSKPIPIKTPADDRPPESSIIVNQLRAGQNITSLDAIDGKLVGGGKNGTIFVWEEPLTDALPIRKTITGDAEVISVRFSNKFTIHVTDSKGFYKTWQIAAPKTELIDRRQNGQRFVVADMTAEFCQPLAKRYEKGKNAGSYSNQACVTLAGRNEFVRANYDIFTRDYYLELLANNNPNTGSRLVDPNEQHRTHISVVTASDPANQLVSIDEEGILHHWIRPPNQNQWTLHGIQQLEGLQDGEYPQSAAFTTDASIIYVTKRGQVRLQSLDSGVKPISERLHQLDVPLSVIVRISDNLYAIGSARGAESKVFLIQLNDPK